MRAFALFLALIASPAAAQTMPVLDPQNPRLQSVHWMQGQRTVLTALPDTGLTVMLEPGEQIERATLDERGLFEIRVSAERDSFMLLPLRSDAYGSLDILTDRREYSFDLQTGDGLMAAYLVRFDYGMPQVSEPIIQFAPTGEVWLYRLKGDRELMPAAISDDGVRTHIVFAPDQALPAIFVIGPTGEEQVTNGHMRSDVYVIDRVYDEIVFRIDREKAVAHRKDTPEAMP